MNRMKKSNFSKKKTTENENSIYWGGMPVLSKGRGERKLYQAEQGRRPGNTITLEGRLISVRTPFVFKVEKTKTPQIPSPAAA